MQILLSDHGWHQVYIQALILLLKLYSPTRRRVSKNSLNRCLDYQILLVCIQLFWPGSSWLLFMLMNAVGTPKGYGERVGGPCGLWNKESVSTRVHLYLNVLRLFWDFHHSLDWERGTHKVCSVFRDNTANFLPFCHHNFRTFSTKKSNGPFCF